MVTTFSKRHDFPVLGEEDKSIILNLLGEKRFSLTCTLIYILHRIRYSPLGVYSNLEPGPQRTKATRVYTWSHKINMITEASGPSVFSCLPWKEDS